MEMSDSLELSSSESETGSYNRTSPLSCSGSGADSGGCYREVFDEQCPWGSLAEELVLDIFRKLTTKDIGTVAQVCRQWRRLGWDRHLLRKLLAGELQWSKNLVDELKNQGENFNLSKGARRKKPWQWLSSVKTLLPDALESLSFKTLASFPHSNGGSEAPVMRNALINDLICTWTGRVKSDWKRTNQRIQTTNWFSMESHIALMTALGSTNEPSAMPKVWDSIFEGEDAVREWELRLLTNAMDRGACRWSKLIVQTIGPVAFSTIKKFLTAVGKQKDLENFHFHFDSRYIQSEKFWGHLSENLIKMPALRLLGFHLTPRSRKDLSREYPWVTQMWLSLRKMARNQPSPILKTLTVTGADDTTALAVFEAVTNTGVRVLNLSDGDITSFGVLALGRLLGRDGTLTHLSLENNRLTEQAMRVILRRLKSNKTLRHLSLLGNKVITDPDLLKLIGELRDRGLQLDVPAPLHE